MNTFSFTPDNLWDLDAKVVAKAANLRLNTFHLDIMWHALYGGHSKKNTYAIFEGGIAPMKEFLGLKTITV